MDYWNTLNNIAWYVFEILGIILTPIVIVSYIWLRKWLTVPLMVKIRGGEMWLHTRGMNITPYHIKTGETSFKKVNPDKTEDVWRRAKNSVKLASGGLPTTFMMDGWGETFAPDQVMDLSLQMAETHLENVKNFTVDVPDDPEGKTTHKELAVDPQLWHLTPRYKLPKMLTPRNLAEQIKSEASARAETLTDQDKKPYYTALAVGGGVFFLVCIVILAKWGMEYNMCKAVGGAIATTTTTIVNTVSTTLTALPPTQM